MFTKSMTLTAIGLLFAAGLAGTSPSIAAEDSDGEAYVVRAGDTLAKIAEHFYEDHLAYPTMVEATNRKAKTDSSFKHINNASSLAIGQKLWVPVLVTLEAADEKGHGVHKTAHWEYQGEGGPTHWGKLDEKFAACDTGKSQSPISVPHNAAMTSASLKFDYKDTALHVLNNGHTVQVNYDTGSTLSVNGKTYEVAQFHFHAPSENTIEGVAAPLEMHIVHVADDGALAVMGVLFDIGEKDNAFLAKFWSTLPQAGHELSLSAKANVASAFDVAGAKFSFSGSLTTPPCSEGVSWFLAAHHESVSKAQLGKFVSLIGINARPTQPLNGRQIGG